ncbi:transcription factor S [Candidatus Woesearchaeota archaeon]|nr:transcription factor S [Candidatus Woesearchaeota archaeon]
MMFCPKCKSIMMPKLEKGKKYLVCGCGYKQEAQSVTLKESVKASADIAVVGDEKSVNVVIDARCPKCDHGKAEYWELQTRSADEPPTRFHKCLKCRHTWREYK